MTTAAATWSKLLPWSKPLHGKARVSSVWYARLSTLSSEAYSYSDAMDALAWTRSVLQEILWDDMTPRQCVTETRIPTASVTDCKSLYDTLTMERVLLSDRRLSL